MTDRPQVGFTRGEWLALGLGLLLAVAIRFLLFPQPGLAGDVLDFHAWAQAIAADGLAHAYDHPISFPAVMPWIWWLLGVLAPGALAQPVDSLAALSLMKLPASVADVGMAAIVSWAVAQRAGPRWALVAALAVLLSPTVIYVSAWWAQYESLYVLPILVAWLLLARGHATWAGVAIGVALMTKPQALPLAVPLAAFYLRRYGVRGSMAPVAASVVTAALLWAPFVASGGVQRYAENLAAYGDLFAVLSLDAWNPWFILQELLSPGRRVVDTTAIVGPVSFRVIGFALAGLLLAYVFVLVWRRPTMAGLAWGLAAGSLAAFIGLTTMHERYSYPALLFVMLAWPTRLAVVTWSLLSVLTILNLLASVPPFVARGELLPIDGPFGIAGSIGFVVAFAMTLAGLRGAGDDADASAAAEPATQRGEVPAQVVG